MRSGIVYKHMIDESLTRAREELKIYQKYHREEEIKHVQKRIDSLLKLREDAPEAVFHISPEPAKPYKPIISFDEYFNI